MELASLSRRGGSAVTPLALGIGVTTTVFTLVNAVLIRGLPFDDPDSNVS